MSHLKQFILWLDEPIEHVGHKKITSYVDYLLGKKLAPKTINCHLGSIHSFYNYLVDQEELQITNPVKKGDVLGVGFNWSRPAEDDFGPGLDDQYTAEIYYRLQVLKVLTVTPDVQLIIDPAFNPQESSIWVFGLRARLAL